MVRSLDRQLTHFFFIRIFTILELLLTHKILRFHLCASFLYKGTCAITSWHSSQILGPPNIYPDYAGDLKGWDLGAENAGHEFIELEFPFAVYINAFELYEVFKPGAVWKISTTAEYLDDVTEQCLRDTCSQKTKWETLWTKPQEAVVPGQERATIFSPPLCPSTVKSKIVRIDLDTKRAPGWNTYDAAKVTGSLEIPPGFVTDTSNRLIYVPLDGVHGVDRFEFASSDCLGESEPLLDKIVIQPPDDATKSSIFYASDIQLALDAGQVASHVLDLTPVLVKAQEMMNMEPNMTATVAWASTLGTKEGEIFADISLDNPTLLLELGAEQKGPEHYFIELWLLDASGLNFRTRYRTVLYIDCLNDGVFDEKKGICLCTAGWGSEDCSKPTNDGVNLGVAIGLPVALAIVMGVLVYLFYEHKRKQNDALWHVQLSEIKFEDPPVVIGRGTFGLVLLAGMLTFKAFISVFCNFFLVRRNNEN